MCAIGTSKLLLYGGQGAALTVPTSHFTAQAGEAGKKIINILPYIWCFRELFGHKLVSLQDYPSLTAPLLLPVRMPVQLVILQHIHVSAWMIISDTIVCQQLMGFSVITIHTGQSNNTEPDAQCSLLHCHSQSHLCLTVCQFFF